MSESQLAWRYSMLIQWLDEDQAFLVTLPEWEGRVYNPVGHGDTYAEAVEAGQIALEQLVSIAIEDGRALPEPHVHTAAA